MGQKRRDFSTKEFKFEKHSTGQTVSVFVFVFYNHRKVATIRATIRLDKVVEDYIDGRPSGFVVSLQPGQRFFAEKIFVRSLIICLEHSEKNEQCGQQKSEIEEQLLQLLCRDVDRSDEVQDSRRHPCGFFGSQQAHQPGHVGDSSGKFNQCRRFFPEEIVRSSDSEPLISLLASKGMREGW